VTARKLSLAYEAVFSVLRALLDTGSMDPYWFHLNQRDLTPEAILRNGRPDYDALRMIALEIGGRQ
jgi:hypothetical protein